MTDEVVARVARSARYGDVDPGLVARLAAEELPRSRNLDDAVKRVKRRLHQAVGAFRGATEADRVLAPIRAAWSGDLADAAFRAACRASLAGHASTRERVGDLDAFYSGIWAAAGGTPHSVVDLACGLGPLALPWMGLERDARIVATDADRRPLAVVAAFLELVGQPHDTEARDLVRDLPSGRADVALLLKAVPTLDRQDPAAAARLLSALRVGHAVVSFPRRSLGGRSRGMERTYRARVDGLVREVGARVIDVIDASVGSELVFVLQLATHG
jgi:16S rRNA (guanine(1405)-N(7))-methyltransferase